MILICRECKQTKRYDVSPRIHLGASIDRALCLTGVFERIESIILSSPRQVGRGQLSYNQQRLDSKHGSAKHTDVIYYSKHVCCLDDPDIQALRIGEGLLKDLRPCLSRIPVHGLSLAACKALVTGEPYGSCRKSQN